MSRRPGPPPAPPAPAAAAPMELIVSESYPGYRYHLRSIGPNDRPPHYGGHVSPQPHALCGREVAWDTHIPVALEAMAREPEHWKVCSRCLEIARRKP